LKVHLCTNLDVEPSHICHMNPKAHMISLCHCAKLSEDNPTKTVKLTPTSSGLP
jgi:hypothetical protein